MSSISDRFDEAEADVDSGTPWLFREPGATNPLTILATGWSTGHTKLGEAEFLRGTDRDGKRWSVLVGCVVLTKRLIEGVFEEWDDDKHAYVGVKTLGRVEPGEVVSMMFLGDREGAKYVYPDFSVVRRPADEKTDAEPENTNEPPTAGGGGTADGIPFAPSVI